MNDLTTDKIEIPSKDDQRYFLQISGKFLAEAIHYYKKSKSEIPLKIRINEISATLEKRENHGK